MKLIFLLSVLTLSSVFNYSPRQEKKIVKAIQKTWDHNELIIEEIEFENSESLLPGDLYFLVQTADQDLGIAWGRKIQDNYLNYFPMFIFNSKHEVEKAVIIEMNTLKGAEINTRSWLKQFIGFKGESIKYGKNIDAVSGATLSGLSMVNEVQRIHGIISQDQYTKQGVFIGQ